MSVSACPSKAASSSAPFRPGCEGRKKRHTFSTAAAAQRRIPLTTCGAPTDRHSSPESSPGQNPPQRPLAPPAADAGGVTGRPQSSGADRRAAGGEGIGRAWGGFQKPRAHTKRPSWRTRQPLDPVVRRRAAEGRKRVGGRGWGVLSGVVSPGFELHRTTSQQG